jgi:hypothetical protein
MQGFGAIVDEVSCSEEMLQNSWRKRGEGSHICVDYVFECKCSVHSYASCCRRRVPKTIFCETEPTRDRQLT